MSEERETRLLMISPLSPLTPDQLVRTVHAAGREVTVKETCYGCLVEGRRSDVRAVRDGVREGRDTEVFSKVRAYPCGDPRRCRAHHGTRPGYSQLETEWAALAHVQRGLEAVRRGERPADRPARKQLPVNVFKRICEADP